MHINFFIHFMKIVEGQHLGSFRWHLPWFVLSLVFLTWFDIITHKHYKGHLTTWLSSETISVTSLLGLWSSPSWAADQVYWMWNSFCRARLTSIEQTVGCPYHHQDTIAPVDTTRSPLAFSTQSQYWHFFLFSSWARTSWQCKKLFKAKRFPNLIFSCLKLYP